MAIVIRLACPADCGGEWTVRGHGETWRDPDGREVAVVAGECDRCGSRVALDPSEQAVEIIGYREQARIDRRASARAALDQVAEVARG